MEATLMKEKIKNNIIKVLLAVVIAMGFYAAGALNKKETGPKTTTVSVKETVLDIAEFSTLDYHYTTIGRFENHKEFYGWKIPFTTSSFLVTYDGDIKIGINFAQAIVEQNDRDIVITLPNAHILSHTIDYDSLEVLDESHSIFTPIVITDYNSFYSDQSKAMEKKALENGLISKARENGRKYLEDFLVSLLDESYSITVK